MNKEPQPLASWRLQHTMLGTDPAMDVRDGASEN